jgi:RNA polymerase sigma-70 factor (ECF subfamily)
MSDDATISELIARARGGDAPALGRLLDAGRHYLAVLARARLAGRLRARVGESDLVQQTLLDAYRGFPDFRGTAEAEWLAWLRRTLDHNAADLARRHGAGRRDAGREVPWDGLAGSSSAAGPAVPAPGETPSAALVRRERELLLADALARLAPDHREVILLRVAERLPFDEVAAKLGRSRPAAQMLFARALARLADAVAAEDRRGDG